MRHNCQTTRIFFQKKQQWYMFTRQLTYTFKGKYVDFPHRDYFQYVYAVGKNQIIIHASLDQIHVMTCVYSKPKLQRRQHQTTKLT